MRARSRRALESAFGVEVRARVSQRKEEVMRLGQHGYRSASFALMCAVATLGTAQPAAPSAKATPLLAKPLAGIDGKEAVMLTVEYPPGVASAPHRHNANTFVYVLEGSVVMQVAGGPEMTLSVGDTFYESPADVHTVSRNASDSKPAKILVVFVKDVGATTNAPADQAAR
jgi:quercetin dioxygenase-like cupin family protein